MEERKEKKSSFGIWVVIIIVIIFLGLISLILAAILSIFSGMSGDVSESYGSGNVAIILVKGVILTETSNNFFSSSEEISSADIVDSIKKASEDTSVKAIVFEINSPGGSGVASDEIATAIKRSGKPTVSYIRDVGASGAYWVASATDKIYANRFSIVGSIGVIGSFIEFSGLMERYNVSYQRFVAGENKDFGVPYRKPTDKERDMYQYQLDQMHQIFIAEVASNRNMSVEEVRELANGFIYTTDDAIKFGLVDEVGGREEVKLYLEKELNMTVEFVEFQKKKNFFDLLTEVSSQIGYKVGYGMGMALVDEGSNPKTMKVMV